MKKTIRILAALLILCLLPALTAGGESESNEVWEIYISGQSGNIINGVTVPDGTAGILTGDGGVVLAGVTLDAAPVQGTGQGVLMNVSNVNISSVRLKPVSFNSTTYGGNGFSFNNGTSGGGGTGGGTTTISALVNMVYGNDEKIHAQFPEASDATEGTGVVISASSALAAS